jgi:glycopeptide antibiotics resistance protein
VSRVRLASAALLALCILLLVWIILFKFSLDFSGVFNQHTRSLNLVPFAEYSRSNWGEVIYNFLVFIPLGLLLSANFPRATFWQKLTFVFMFSLGAEAIQYALAIGATDITDLIANTAGGFLGLLMYDWANRHVDHHRLNRFIVVAGSILLVIVTLAAAILLSSGVRYQPGNRSAPGSQHPIREMRPPRSE